jgi:hypothetical protein
MSLWHPDQFRYSIASPERAKAVALHTDLGGWLLKAAITIPGQNGRDKFVVSGLIDQMALTRVLVVTDSERDSDHARYAVPYFDGADEYAEVTTVFGVSQQGVTSFDPDKGWGLVDLQTIEGLRRDVMTATQSPDPNLTLGNAALFLLQVHDYFGAKPGY